MIPAQPRQKIDGVSHCALLRRQVDDPLWAAPKTKEAIMNETTRLTWHEIARRAPRRYTASTIM
jgi:hypothetical protein